MAILAELGLWLRIWLSALKDPSFLNFERLARDNQLTSKRAFLWLLLATSLPSLVVFVFASLNPDFAEIFDYRFNSIPDSPLAQSSLFFALVIWAIFLIAFLVWIGLLHILARLFGGTGDLRRFFSISAAFMVPLMLLSYATFWFPLILPGVISYGLILTIQTVSVVHGLRWGKSIAAVLLLPLGTVLGPILVALGTVGSDLQEAAEVYSGLTFVYSYAGACFGCWGFPLPLVVLGIMGIRNRALRPFLLPLFILMLFSLLIFILGVSIGTEQGWDMDIL